MRIASNRLAFGIGCVAAVALGVSLAEVFLRLSPPRDLHIFQGEASPMTGLYRPHPHFGVTYQSWEVFARDNAKRIGPLPFRRQRDGRKMWALFGNSFIQAPGMLGDQVRRHVPDRRAYYLGKNEYIFVRFAQIELLLQHGLKPDRIIVSLMPVDLLQLGEQPLDTIHVTSKGAMTYRPRLPDGYLGWGINQVQFLQTAWFRAGLQKGNRQFNKKRIHEYIEEPLLGDVRKLFTNLARVTARHRVPVTVLLIPSYDQIHEGASCGFQEMLIPIFRDLGLDVCFPIAGFRNQPNTAELFIPDKHFSERGNQVLLHELLAHVRPLEEADLP